SQDAVEPLPLLELGVDAIEVLERGPIRRCNVEDVAVRLLRASEIVELLFEDDRQTQARRDALLELCLFVLEDIGVSRGEPRPAFVDNRRQTIELINDALIARGELRGADQDLEGAIDVDELLLTFLRHTEQEFEALSGIFQSRKLTLADVEQLLPATGRLVERLEHLADAQHFRAGREQVFECAERTFML